MIAYLALPAQKIVGSSCMRLQEHKALVEKELVRKDIGNTTFFTTVNNFSNGTLCSGNYHRPLVYFVDRCQLFLILWELS